MQLSQEIVCGHVFYRLWLLEPLGIFPNHRGFIVPNYSNIDDSNAPSSFQLVQLRGGLLVP